MKSRSSVHSSVSWSLPVSLLSSRGLPLTASTSRGRGRRLLIRSHSHTHCHTCSLSVVSVLQAVQQSICCYLSVSPPPPCPIQSPSQLPGFVQSPSVSPPHSDQSLPHFLIQHGSVPPPPSRVDSAICPRGSWDFQAHSKYTAENSHHDESFNLVANQTCFHK